MYNRLVAPAQQTMILPCEIVICVVVVALVEIRVETKRRRAGGVGGRRKMKGGFAVLSGLSSRGRDARSSRGRDLTGRGVFAAWHYG